MFTINKAARAIEALINGSFDNPALQKAGLLSFSTTENIERIIKAINPLELLDGQENIIAVAQVDGLSLDADLIQRMRTFASFKDTDRSLNEFLIPVSELPKLAGFFDRYKDKTAMDQAGLLYNKHMKCQYLHITFV